MSPKNHFTHVKIASGNNFQSILSFSIDTNYFMSTNNFYQYFYTGNKH